MAKRQPRAIRELKTILIMGEGEHEEAFLEHMKLVYNQRLSGKKVTIDYNGGGSPHDIVKYTVKQTYNANYDLVYILMDCDVKISAKDLATADKKGFVILESDPLCLEGMLLEVINQTAPKTSYACKSKLHPKLSGNPSELSSYSPLFNKPVLDKTSKATIVTLREVLAKTY